MAEGGSPERHKDGVLGEEENENRNSGVGHSIGKRAGSSEEAERDCVAGQPVDRDSHETAALTDAWVHGFSVARAAAIRDVSHSTMM